jgi:ankyrin repeat protein
MMEKRARSDVIGTDGMTPLHYAAGLGGGGQIARTLIDHNGSVNARTKEGWTPLHFAAYSGNLAAAKVLLDYGADPNSREVEGRRTPLHFAAVAGHTDVAKLLLANNLESDRFAGAIIQQVLGVFGYKAAEVNARDKDGSTPTHVAAAKGFNEIVSLLKRYGGQE